MADPLTVPAAPVATQETSVWMESASILGLGLFAARVGSEVLPGSRDAAQLVFSLMVGLVFAWFATRLLTSLHIRHPELALLLIYVGWPQLNLYVAWAVGLLAVGVWLWRVRPVVVTWLAPAAGWLPETVTGLTALLLYTATIAPDVLPADGGEFQLVGATLGIAHPPGYALYTMLARLASLVPVGSPAQRISLLSVAFAALTLFAVARFVREVPGRGAGSRGVSWAAVLGAATLAGSPTFWVQATTANIRSLTALFTIALMLLAVRFAQNPTPRRLATLSVVFGLAAGHHSSLVLLGLPLVLYLVLACPDPVRHPKRWIRPACVGLLSFLVLLYLPIRSAMQPAFDPVPVTSLARFLDHVLALGFRGDVLYVDSWATLLERTLVYVQILRLQFGAWLPWAMVLGLIVVFALQWRLGVLLGGVWLINALSAITYRAPQTVEYLLPSYVAMAASLGCGLRLVVERLPHLRRTGLMLSLVSVLLVRQVLILWPDMVQQHGDTSTRTAAMHMLQQAPEDAVILSNWHNYTPMLYLQLVEGLRDDVEIVYVYPEGDATNAETWMARITAELPLRPVVVTNWFYEYQDSGLSFEPLADGWLVQSAASDNPPDAARRVAETLGERIRVEAVSAPDQATPGETLHVDLYWRPLVRLDRDYAVSVQLLGSEGVLGQADRSQLTSTFAPDEMRADSYEVPLLLQTLPGTYRLVVGFYTMTADGWERLTTEAGEDIVELGQVTVTQGYGSAATLNPTSVFFAGGDTLIGLDVDRSVADTTRLYLHWTRVDGTPGSSATVVALGDDGAELASTTVPALYQHQIATTVLDLTGEPHQVRLTLRTSSGATLAPLTICRMPWRESVTLPLPAGERRYVPLGGMVVYTGISELPEHAAPGDTVAVRPRLLSLRPLTRDISLSAGLVGESNGWESKADGTPALGAIPTLKWLTGWQVTSLYEPVVPADVVPGLGTITLEAYDAFTLTPLAVLDERLVQQGQGNYLVIGTLPITEP